MGGDEVASISAAIAKPIPELKAGGAEYCGSVLTWSSGFFHGRSLSECGEAVAARDAASSAGGRPLSREFSLRARPPAQWLALPEAQRAVP